MAPTRGTDQLSGACFTCDACSWVKSKSTEVIERTRSSTLGCSMRFSQRQFLAGHCQPTTSTGGPLSAALVPFMLTQSSVCSGSVG